MGSSLSPVIANMVIEDLEQLALSTFYYLPSIWVRYVDDVYAFLKTETLMHFINTLTQSILQYNLLWKWQHLDQYHSYMYY